MHLCNYKMIFSNLTRKGDKIDFTNYNSMQIKSCVKFDYTRAFPIKQIIYCKALRLIIGFLCILSQYLRYECTIIFYRNSVLKVAFAWIS